MNSIFVCAELEKSFAWSSMCMVLQRIAHLADRAHQLFELLNLRPIHENKRFARFAGKFRPQVIHLRRVQLNRANEHDSLLLSPRQFFLARGRHNCVEAALPWSSARALDSTSSVRGPRSARPMQRRV